MTEMTWGGLTTWYEVVGGPGARDAGPVVVCHGGPGATHDDVRSIAGHHVIGTIRDWDITGRLGEIDVPTLLVSGRHDEATPRIVGEMRDRIPGAEWELFEASSHMPHVEEPERFLDVVGAFLARADPAPA